MQTSLKETTLSKFGSNFSRLCALRRTARASLLVALVGAAVVAGAPAAHAATTITVDGATCTLADAITAANTDTTTGGCAAGSGADTIELTADVTLTSALPSISSVIILNGNGHTVKRDSGASNFRILDVLEFANLTVNNATITGGVAPGGTGDDSGGGIRTVGALTVNNSTISSNSARAGGGIATAIVFGGSGGPVTINNSVITGNTAVPGDGGGILSSRTTLTVSGSTISNNTAEQWGGGIKIGGDAAIAGSTLVGNSSGEWGGGIDHANGKLSVTNSTISGNTAGAKGGGGIHSIRQVVLDSTTITGNTAPTGGAIWVNNDFGSPAQFTLRNTILADSTGGVADCRLVSGASVIDGGHNLVETPGECTFASGSSIVGQDPRLGLLQDNDGPTQTHELLPGSPAIDAGDTTLATDQRGVARPQGATDDIGAFESQAITLTIVKQAVGGDGTFEIGSTFDSEVLVPVFSLTTQGGTAQRTFDLAAGFYELGENAPAGWELTNAKCVGTAQGSVFVLPEGYLRFNASPGDDITCTFTNSKLGSIKIVKKTQGGDGTFSYSSQQLGNFRLTTQKKEADRLFTGVAPGIYSVSEAPTKGWDLTNAICSNGSNPGSINVALGENVTCSFTNVKRGSITVVKTSVGGDATFGFTSAALSGFSMATVGGTAQRTFDNLVAGTYDLSESALTGWAQTGAICSDGSTLPNVNVAAGEDVTCTFTNTKQGSLTVVKQAQGNDATFAFTSAALGNFNLTTVNGRASQTFANLNPGAYDLSEAVPAGWRQTSATCSDGSTLPNVNVAAGEDVTCTFANEQLDTILIVKLALGGDDTFSFTSAALGNFTMTTSSGAAVKAFSGLTPGNYAVAESASPGWNAAEADPTCSNGNKASNINLASGQLVVCIFVNLKPDTIVVEKRTVGGDGSFGFSSNLPGAGSFTLVTANSAASRIFNNLPPATYNISETPQAGWAQTGVSCDNGATPDSINLMPGMTVRCIFTDTKLSNITVVKQATGGDGSFSFTGSLGSFNLTTAGGTAQRTFANILPGSHRINETTPAGWRQTSAGCADGSNPASLNLGAGKNVTCTFANTKLGSLTVMVDTTGGNGTFGFTSTALGNFDIPTAAGTGQKAFANLMPGTYDLTEVALGGWDLGLATCSNGSNPANVTVGAGENVVCTFEYTDARKRLYLPIINKQ